ncbi:MAG: peptidase S8, partial [Anaerolineae bacterium]|nr:peptidase S8 [Anaerolineae bacterium]
MAQEEIGLRLVQFSGPIQDEWHEAMLASGLEVVSYIPDYAYLVWGSGSSVNRLASLVPLRWSGVYQPYYALHPSLIETLKLHKEEEVAVNVQLYAYAGVDTTLHAIQKQAQKIIAPPYPVLNYLNLRISVPSSQLTALASLPGVVNIEPYAIPKLLDEVQTQILAGNLNAAGTQPSGPGYLAWLQSLGFPTNPNEYPIIDITDDGIEDGDDTPIHPDFFELGNTANPDRLVYNYNWTSDPSANGVGGHGTINASIAVGYNNSSGFP